MTGEIPKETAQSSEVLGVPSVELTALEQSTLAWGDPNGAAFHAVMLDKGIQPGVVVEVKVGDKNIGPHKLDEKGRWAPHSPEVAGQKEVSEEIADELGDKGFNLTGPENPTEVDEWVEEPTMFPETTRVAIYMEDGVRKEARFVGSGQRKSGNVILVKPDGFEGPYKEISIEGGGVLVGQYDTANDEKNWGPRKVEDTPAGETQGKQPEISVESPVDKVPTADEIAEMMSGEPTSVAEILALSPEERRQRDKQALESYATVVRGLARNPGDTSLEAIKQSNLRNMSEIVKKYADKYARLANAEKET
jgi:hypothetical protein